MPSHLGVFFSFHKVFTIWNIMGWVGNILNDGKKFISLPHLKKGQTMNNESVQLQLGNVYQVFRLFQMNPLADIGILWILWNTEIFEILWNIWNTLKTTLNTTFPTFSYSVDHPLSLNTQSWKFLYLTCTRDDFQEWALLSCCSHGEP